MTPGNPNPLLSFTDEEILTESRRRNLTTTSVNELRDYIKEMSDLYDELMDENYPTSLLLSTQKRFNAIRQKAGLQPK